jgi:transposase
MMREVVNGLMYILSTGCQWRAIPKDLPNQRRKTPRLQGLSRPFKLLRWARLHLGVAAFCLLLSVRRQPPNSKGTIIYLRRCRTWREEFLRS